MVDIQVKNLTKFFVIGENLLEGLSFEIQEGECVAILGRNGCGKTTLFNILTGQMDYDDGEVYYKAPIVETYESYLADRKEVYGDRKDKFVCLMDLALMAIH